MSKRKNPYESQETVDIPDFLMKKEEIEQEEEIENRSRFSRKIFNQDSEDEGMSTRGNKVRSIKLNERALMLIGGLLLALLLLTLISFIYGVNKSNALKTKELEYQELAKSINEKDLQIKKLQEEIDELKKGGSTPAPSGDNQKQTKYLVIAEVLNVRKKPTTEEDNIVRQLVEGQEVIVYGDLVENNGRWGNIGTDEWICIYTDQDRPFAEETK